MDLVVVRRGLDSSASDRGPVAALVKHMEDKNNSFTLLMSICILFESLLLLTRDSSVI